MYTPVNDDGTPFKVVNNGMPNNDGTLFNIVNNKGTLVNRGTPDSVDTPDKTNNKQVEIGTPNNAVLSWLLLQRINKGSLLQS